MAFPRVRFAIDRGGTFTDVVAIVRDSEGREETRQLKLLSRSPAYLDAPSEGIRRVLQQLGLAPAESNSLIDASHVDSIRMGTTIATNALLERKGVPFALVVTKGFADLPEIGTQARPDLFALNIEKPSVLHSVVIEAVERVRIVPGTASGASAASEEKDPQPEIGLEDADLEAASAPTKATAAAHAASPVAQVVEPLDEVRLRADLVAAHAQGLRSVAISLLHAHLFPHHGAAAARIAREVGFSHASLSSELMPMIRYYPRTTTAAVDAYLTPLLQRYVEGFRAQFVDLSSTELLFIQSDGGLTFANTFYGFRAVLSGPAGGVVGYTTSVQTAFAGEPQRGDIDAGAIAVVGFDMGGTSTDVSRTCGELQHVTEAAIAGIPLQAPQLDIQTVAAGGGSILHWRDGMFVVGPDSAGAQPGPAAYGHGGPLTITDANLLLGRLQAAHFPHVFGKDGKQPLDVDAVARGFDALAAEVNASLASTAKRGKNNTSSKTAMLREEIAMAFIEVANEAMARPIRNITEAKGYHPAEHVLSSFGGAGGQHACAVAALLGIPRVHVSSAASVLSALGISQADVVEEAQLPCGRRLAEGAPHAALLASLAALEARASSRLLERRFSASSLRARWFLNLRYEGSSTALMVPVSSTDVDAASIAARLEATFHRQFGFTFQNRGFPIVDDIRVRVLASGNSQHAAASNTNAKPGVVWRQAEEKEERDALPPVKVFFGGGDGWLLTPVFDAPAIAQHLREAEERTASSSTTRRTIDGPALINLASTALLVEPGCKATVWPNGDVVVVTAARPISVSVECDPLPLSVFAHRFMSIAEQMGVTLQRTAISTNIKERLDFSCGFFDADGGLVANAPHIPVHLGAMGAAVRFQRDLLGADWREGDVVVSNAPAAGGSHLPDITVITPCWSGGRCVFYVASRGHHADIGGSTPGSMPPFSKSLAEEGAIIHSFKLVEGGVFQEDGIRALLLAPERSGYSGCRCLNDVLSDLRAQVSANRRGVELLGGLIAQYGLEVVLAYMTHVQSAGEQSIRALLRRVAAAYPEGDCASATAAATATTTTPASDTRVVHLRADDAMDDGTPICVDVSINSSEGSAVFDFRRSGPQVLASSNCPTAVVRSAILYCLRCMLGVDVPLNEGCMRPVTVLTAPHSILNPDSDLGVVAGNVLTSQRLTDVIFFALRAVSNAQGDMNNLTFGNARFGYYETICGGAGAGPGFHGASAVHTHMTNTRITDPEILETRYPVLLLEFSIRRGTGGDGQWRGGDGITRSLMFLDDLTVCLLSERRALAPKGLAGGGSAGKGSNLLARVVRSEKDKDGAVSATERVDALFRDRETGTPQLLPWRAPSSSIVNVGAKNVLSVIAGDVLHIMTPGGAGYGAASTDGAQR